jgi:hypothetical protein
MRKQVLVWFVLLAACGGNDEGGLADAPAGGSDGAGTDSATTGDGAPGGICGGFAGAKCDADEYCDYGSNDCGATDGIGTCLPRPTGCPDPIQQPTCGCDGQVYSIPCDAYAAGTDLNAVGGCPIDPGMFQCGWTQCAIGTAYCQRQVSDVAGQPDEFSCITMPNCPGPTGGCTCLAAAMVPCADQCAGDDTTGVTVTCPGG